MRRPAAVIAGLVTLLLFGAAGIGAVETVRHELEVAGMSCAQCARSATEALRKIEGVTEARVDFETKRALVVGDERVDREAISEALRTLGFEPRFPGEEIPSRLTEPERESLDIAVASRGERIDLEEHLVEGKYTIFDFWAEWCGPCHLLTPKLERLVQESGGRVALRTVDLRDWKSPVAAQATEEFAMSGLPYVRVYAPGGRFLGAVVGNHFEEVEALLDRSAE